MSARNRRRRPVRDSLKISTSFDVFHFSVTKKVCGFFCGSATATATTERFFEALRVNNVEVFSVEDKVEENEDAFYVCESSTSGGRLLT